MTTPASTTTPRGTRTSTAQGIRHPAQRGVVLIISLIMILVISVLAVTSMRNVASSEIVSGNVRTTELATQAADIALRHCESSVVKITKLIADPSDASAEASYPTTLAEANVIRAASAGAWQSTSTWDTTSTPFVLPATLVGGTATFTRRPECMVESLTGIVATGPPASFVITARGFGPEVTTTAGSGRPIGTVVWLQSTLDIQ